MDITVGTRTRRRRVKSNPPPETYDGVVVNMRCVYCGHNHNRHVMSPLMIHKAGKVQRKTIGLKDYHCRQCAEEKETNQVVCYQVPDRIYELAAARGLVIS